MLFKQMPEPKEVERPWQGDIDRLQQTLQEVLQAISSLSGIELPGASTDSQATGNPQPRLDAKTLKDHIRSDLEAFASTTASEMARQAERQARLALTAIHNEATGQVDQVARELREKLQGQFEPERIEIGITQQTHERIAEMVQKRTDEYARWVWLMCKGTGTPIPVQIEKLLGPYVEEATARLTESFRQQFQSQLTEHEQLALQRLQGTLSSVEGQIGSLEQAAQTICERNADAVTKASADRLNAVAEEAARSFETKMREQIESAFGIFQSRIDQAAASLQDRLRQAEDQQAGSYTQRIAQLQAEVEGKAMAEISGRAGQVAANVVESSLQHLQKQADDTMAHSKEDLKGYLEFQMEDARQRINELGRTMQDSMSEAINLKTERLNNLDQEITAIREKHVAASQEQISSMVQATLESMTGRIRQVSDAQLEEIGKFVKESQEKAASQYDSQLRGITGGWYNKLLDRLQLEANEAGVKVSADVKGNADSVLRELSEKVDASAAILREEATQATSRIESVLKNSLETYQQQLSQITHSRLEEHRRAIRTSLTDLQGRLERSASALRQELADRLDTNSSDAPAGNQSKPEESAGS